jgi:tRNA U34 2-thiouridine synthase MnmA/TrmU
MDRVVTGVALYSGGLDSILSIKLILDQGAHVEAIIFKTPFLSAKINDNIPLLADYNHLRFKKIDITRSFMKILASPKYGYGKNLNPCIDCRILMLREAKLYMEKIGADFVFTGEVLGQRPMSQRRDLLRISEKESGLEGILLRPLSAKLLNPTQMEDAGLIDRDKLLDLKGRSRKKQIEMAKDLNWNDFPTPGGGCLLTDKAFANKLKPFLERGITNPDILKWLRIGRHFVLPCGTRIVVGRNHIENSAILDMAGKEETLIKTVTVPGPVAIILGESSEDIERFAASLMAGYSDCKGQDQVEVATGKGGDFKKEIKVCPLARKDSEVYRI